MPNTHAVLPIKPSARAGGRALAALIIAAAPLLVGLPSAAQNQLKDLLGRAQQGLDGKAVEDLIGKLEGGKQKAAPPAANPAPPPAAGQPVGQPLGKRPPTEAPPEIAKPSIPMPPPAPPHATLAAPPALAVPAPAAAPLPPVPEVPQPAPTATMPATQSPASASPAPPRPASVPPPAPSSAEAAVAGADRQQLPSVDLEITFEFDSAEIDRAALPTLALLGRALSDPRLATATFLIAGHTDALGNAAYNQKLSQQRAEAVQAFLIANYNVDPKRLTAQGFGVTRLKNPRHPSGKENRRVQIVNTSALAAR